ncbi:uncharacterized protein LOC111086262 isoform X2 [Limulus polyphemus]|uniref:Uncharacterized protein LOC111086262 isoform X2 n=1 Tax=Limulus polyphemus TaxID=6850 RepID=A0ABM1SKI9_LIMPO|nr:uncharacterized protein LOC111086262 isoform X2 [Limulus polyphemus]
MEGLSLEYRDLESTTEICRRKNGPQATENTISQKLELLQELLKQKKDLTNRKHRCLPKTQSLDQTTNCFHQETLQKATHLRQRKISTQLKMDTLQKKLQDDKKWEPKSIYKIPQIQQHFQDQLVELNRTLQEIDSDLGKAEHELGESFRELNIVSNTHVKKHTSRNSPFRRDQPEIYQEKLPKIRISKSVDDCRDVSLKTKATKLISSPKLRKLKDDSAKTGSPMSSSWVAKTFSKEEDCDFMADRKQSQLSLSPHTIKLRKSPLCVLGNFMEAQIRERIMLHRRNKSAEHNVEAAKKDYAHFRRRSTSNENIVFRSRNSAASRSAGKLGEDAQPAEKDKCQIRDEHNNTCYPKNIENEGYTKVKTVIKPEVLAEIKANTWI